MVSFCTPWEPYELIHLNIFDLLKLMVTVVLIDVELIVFGQWVLLAVGSWVLLNDLSSLVASLLSVMKEDPGS